MKSNNRDVSTFLNEYQKIVSESKNHAGDIYASELIQLFDLSKGNLYNAICNGYEFGFIAGLHYAKNQEKKKKQRCTSC